MNKDFWDLFRKVYTGQLKLLKKNLGRKTATAKNKRRKKGVESGREERVTALFYPLHLQSRRRIVEEKCDKKKKRSKRVSKPLTEIF